jgi:hypothetical protein
MYLTGYKPSRGIASYLIRYILLFTAVPFVALWYFVRLGHIRFPAYWSVWYQAHKPKAHDRDVINYNLFKLSEMLDFAFTLEGNTITLNRVFANNPIPELVMGEQVFPGKKFIRDISPFTNITGREFSDCFDLYSSYNKTQDAEKQEKCVDKIISILYPAVKDYNENLVENHTELIRNLPPEYKTGILLWFSGIVEYYLTHPYYSLLFRSPASESPEVSGAVNLGMNEIVLMITRQGYNENDNVNNFFDAQLMVLKKNLSDMLASGVKIEDLARKTNMSIGNINKLIS